jgi:putative membrane protein
MKPVFHRIHPLTIVIELPRALRQLFVVILIVAVQIFQRGSTDSETQVELYLSLLGLMVVVPALLRYFSYGYAIHQGNLLIKSGIITKNLRTIPLDRIQNINFKRTLLHRILGLVDVQIETAAGGAAEAAISALTDEQAHVLRAQLTGERPRSYSPVLEARDKKIVYKPTTREILLVGASENRALTILAAIFGLLALPPFQQTFFNAIDRDTIRSATRVPAQQQNWLLWGGLMLAFFAVGWIVSIVSTFVKYYDFEITEKEGKIKRAYGLFNHFENTVPLRRIQTVHVSQNFVQRWLNISKMYVATAGGFGGEKRNEEVQVQTAPLLTPVLRESERDSMMRLTLPKYDLSSPDWREVSKSTFWRHLRSGFLPSLAISLISVYWLKWGAAAVFVGLMALAAFSGYIYWRTARWAQVSGVLATRVGWLKRQWNFLPGDKIQAVTISQTPTQRVFGLATVTCSSAAATFQSTEIDDLPVDEAVRVATEFHEVSARGRDSLLDGF